MKKLLYLMLMLLCLTSCGTMAMVATIDDIYGVNYIDPYYNDALYVNYEIVWVNDWPYWRNGTHFVPYHHHHTLRYIPKHWSYRTYKPELRHNNYQHRYQPDYRSRNRNNYTQPNTKYKPHPTPSPSPSRPRVSPDFRNHGSNLHNPDNNRPKPNAGNKRFNQPVKPNTRSVNPNNSRRR